VIANWGVEEVSVTVLVVLMVFPHFDGKRLSELNYLAMVMYFPPLQTRGFRFAITLWQNEAINALGNNPVVEDDKNHHNIHLSRKGEEWDSIIKKFKSLLQ
jgi:hypothetical protein